MVIQSDDGLNWKEFYRPLASTLVPNNIDIINDDLYLTNSNQTATIVGGDGKPVRSISTIFPYVREFRFVNRDIVFAKVEDELESYLVKSVDAGRSWRIIASGTFKILSVRSANEIFIAKSLGQEYPSDTLPYVGVIAYTQDSGETWEESATIRGLFSAVRKTQRVAENTDMIMVDDTILTISTAAQQ